MSPIISDSISEIENSLPALATANEAAKVLRMSGRNLRRMIVAGRISALRARESGSSRVLVPRAEIGRYLRSLAGQP